MLAQAGGQARGLFPNRAFDFFRQHNGRSLLRVEGAAAWQQHRAPRQGGEASSRHELKAAHADFVAKPLLWSFAGGPGGVEGGGGRYIYLRRGYAMLRQVFCRPMVTTTEQRRAGAPKPTESLEQRARRLAAGLTAAQRAVDWPIHVAEIEPSWAERGGRRARRRR